MASRQQDEKLQIVADAIGVDCLSFFNLVCLLGLMLTIRSWLLWISYYTRKCNKNHRKQFSVQRKVELQASWRFFSFLPNFLPSAAFWVALFTRFVKLLPHTLLAKKNVFYLLLFFVSTTFFSEHAKHDAFCCLKRVHILYFCISIVVQCQKLLNLILIHDGNRKFGTARKKKKKNKWMKQICVGG